MSDIARELFKSIVTGNASQEDFDASVQQKFNQAMEVRKVRLAASVYGSAANDVEESADTEDGANLQEVNEASEKDVEKLIKYFVGMGHGHTRKGNSIDFGGGSVIEFSFDKGKIKFDGGKAAGKGHFNNLKDAIATLTIGMED